MNGFGARARAVLGVLVAVLAVVAGFLLTGPDNPTGADAELVRTHDGGTASIATITAPPQTAGPSGTVPVPVPDAAWATLAEIDAGRWPGSANATGTKGGDVWRNRDGTLPRSDSSGMTISYREWDVNPKVRGQTRDAERIVTGSDTSAWYTGDHYTSFRRMR